jgi:hypothetical protein
MQLAAAARTVSRRLTTGPSGDSVAWTPDRYPSSVLSALTLVLASGARENPAPEILAAIGHALVSEIKAISQEGNNALATTGPCP